MPVGTSVVAPTTLQVSKVGFSQRAGRYIVANVMREGGDFDDGDGYRLTFAHLSAIRVEEGDIVQRGQTAETFSYVLDFQNRHLISHHRACHSVKGGSCGFDPLPNHARNFAAPLGD